MQNLIQPTDGDWFETYTGKRCFPSRLSDLSHIDEICNPEDIAHSLSLQCRFLGHCDFHWSIAAHSIVVSQIATHLATIEGIHPSINLQLGAMLHDAHEAYIGDIISPIKRSGITSELYKEIEGLLIQKIFMIFDCYPNKDEMSIIKKADMLALKIESRHMMRTGGKEWDVGNLAEPNGLNYMAIREYHWKIIKSKYKYLLDNLIG